VSNPFKAVLAAVAVGVDVLLYASAARKLAADFGASPTSTPAVQSTAY
jgi:hypothetical protein